MIFFLFAAERTGVNREGMDEIPDQGRPMWEDWRWEDAGQVCKIERASLKPVFSILSIWVINKEEVELPCHTLEIDQV